MPIATNPDTGAVQFLDADGAWKPARTAVNPQTKEMMAFDGKGWAAVPAQSKGVLGYIDDAVRSLASGATFGYADEIAAKANELVGSGTYESNIAKERARDAQIPTAIKLPGEIAGAVGSTIAAAPVTAAGAVLTGASRLPQIARNIGIGATGGALFGSGDAEEGGRLEGAAKGAALGSVLGTAAPYVASGVSRAAQAVKGVFSPETQVARELSRAITRDSDTPAAFANRFEALNAERPGVAVPADAGGENVRGLVERVAQTPGAGRTIIKPALTERQQDQMGRFVGDLRELTGTERTAYQAIDQTLASRAKAADPLYKQAYEDGDKVVWSPELERLSSSPTVRSAMAGAVRKWRDFAIADGYGAMNPSAMVKDGNLSLGGGQLPITPNIQFWDYTKRMIDRKVDAAITAGDGDTARVLTNLNKKLRAELDDQVPSFGAARSAWEGPSKYMDAVTDGKAIFSNKVSAEELAATFPKMTEAEQEGFRIGALSAITGKMGSDSAKLGDMTKYLRSPEMKGKIAALMPTEEAASKWAKRLDFEVKSSELTGQALGNSATARRLAEKQDAENIAGDLVLDMMTSGAPVKTLWHTIFSQAPKKVRDTLRSRSDASLAETLAQAKDAGELRQILEGVTQRATPLSAPTQAGVVSGANALIQP